MASHSSEGHDTLRAETPLACCRFPQWEICCMAIDQSHVKANAVIKGDGGAIGVADD